MIILTLPGSLLPWSCNRIKQLMNDILLKFSKGILIPSEFFCQVLCTFTLNRCSMFCSSQMSVFWASFPKITFSLAWPLGWEVVETGFKPIFGKTLKFFHLSLENFPNYIIGLFPCFCKADSMFSLSSLM